MQVPINTPSKKPKLFILSLIMMSLASSNIIWANEQQELSALVKELDYLIEVAETMQKKYGQTNQSSNQRIRFNYPALIEQLKTTRIRTTEFLVAKDINLKVDAPKVMDQSLIRLK